MNVGIPFVVEWKVNMIPKSIFSEHHFANISKTEMWSKQIGYSLVHLIEGAYELNFEDHTFWTGTTLGEC